MSNFSEQQKVKTEVKEKNKVRKEKLAGYFFNLSQLTFAALVLGGVTPLFTNQANISNWITIPFGILSTYVFATIANRILKY